MSGCCDEKMREVREATVATLWHCAKCGRWVCASELNEQDLCDNCAGEEFGKSETNL